VVPSGPLILLVDDVGRKRIFGEARIYEYLQS